MNDETEKPDEKRADTEDRSPRAGERLAEARRERQITVLEIAKELHLDEPKVRALENNEFETLGAPVFAKGHLRKYAHLVGVDQDDVLTDYYKLTRSQVIPPVVADRRKTRRDFSPGPWIAAIVVLAVVALAYWMLSRQPPPPATASSQPVIEEPIAAEAEQEPADAGTAETEAAPSDSDTAPAVADDVDPEATDVVASEPEPAVETPSEPMADGGVRLTIEFLGDCWTEIFDASGRRLYYNMGREGQTVDVGGPGPLSVLFGDADNVSLAVNGEAFTIADADRNGRTARFALNGP